MTVAEKLKRNLGQSNGFQRYFNLRFCDPKVNTNDPPVEKHWSRGQQTSYFSKPDSPIGYHATKEINKGNMEGTKSL